MIKYRIICKVSDNYLEHKDHKYIKKEIKNGKTRYYYTDTKNGSGEKTSDEKTSEETKETTEETTVTDETNKETTEENDGGFDLEEMANKVIRGEFGNGTDRKEALGDSYADIQKRVNEILKGSSGTSSTVSKSTVEKGSNWADKLINSKGFNQMPTSDQNKLKKESKKK